ncbi:MAG: glutamate 5-kinase [Acidimicrobiia bacterium]|nr:glutamate 5-kinase [Acidimicrobiia bacterium]
MRAIPGPGRPIVVKVGSSSLTFPTGGIDTSALDRAVEGVVSAWEGGRPTVLVTSAAIAAGLPVLNLPERPTDLPGLQVAAAVGQVWLMRHYSDAFAARGRTAAQVLLTKDVLANREQYLHSRAALGSMLNLGIVPVVNENDTVVVDELKLGDNDRLAAIVSHLVGAGLLVLLTDTHGLYSADPRSTEDAELLSAVRHTDEILDKLSGGSKGPLGSGGVATKIAAARMAAWSGIPTVVASAREPDVLARILAGEDVGTWIEPHPSGLTARKLWIAFGLPSRGRIVVDQGAVTALTAGGRSLLAVGIKEVEGTFGAGSAVEVIDEERALIAKGIVGHDHDDVVALKGKRANDRDDDWNGVVIHRDDLVVLAG